MDIALQQLLNTLETFGSEFDAQQTVHDNKMRNLDADAAKFMSILARSGNCQRILEIGTSNGYSTIWLAWVASITGGHVISIERNLDRQNMVLENLQQARLLNHVDLRLGNASEIIKGLVGTFDFVFFDADRLSAPEQLKLLLPKIESGALVIADNVLSHPDQIAGYLEAISTLPDFDHMVVPIGKGISLAYRR